jgi:hypothetical protein
MVRIIAILSAILIASATQAATEQDLWGSWKLVSASHKDVATGEVSDAYGGPHPTGYINYGKDHRMIVMISFDNRVKPASVDGATPEQRIQLFNSMLAYAGTYSIVGNSIEHHVDASWNENRTGTTLIRDFAFDGDKLVLTTRPYMNFDGKTIIVTLLWQKVA